MKEEDDVWVQPDKVGAKPYKLDKKSDHLNISTDNTETVKNLLSQGMNATQISKAMGKSRNWVK